MYTLHGYFLRELLKTFALTTVALTVMLTMGGLVFNILRFEGLQTSDVPMIVPLLMPMMLTIAMPVSAMFSATITYGRFAADNEILACRAAGVNVHKMLLAAMLLGLFVSLTSLFAANILIPRIVSALENYARNNLGVLAASKLESNSFVDFSKDGSDSHLLTTAGVTRPTNAQLAEKGYSTDPRIQYLLIYGPRYLMRGPNNEMRRFVAAEVGFCQFDARQIPVELRVTVKNAYDYEVGQGALFLAEQTIDDIKLSFPMRPKPATADLRTLFSWLREPWEGAKVKPDFDRFRFELERFLFFQYVIDRVARGETIELLDDLENKLEVKIGEAAVGEQALRLSDIRIKQIRNDGTELSEYRAQRGVVAALLPGKDELFTNPIARTEVEVRITLTETAEQPVIEKEPKAISERQHDSHTFAGLFIPEAPLAASRSISSQSILDLDEPLEIPPPLVSARESLVKAAAKLRFKVLSLINFRFALALAVLAIIMYAATLGIAFRGNQMLSAFGLACIPGGAVSFIIYLAKSMAERPATHEVGIMLMWGGMVAVLLLHLITLRLFVRR
ncbi:MAG: LptF/LptG family permease [Phycisphaerae bacterium]